MKRPTRPVKCSVGAEALRKAGLVPLPRLWVPASVIPEIHKIADPYGDQVNAIRGKARQSMSDPKTSRAAAWAAAEKSRKS